MRRKNSLRLKLLKQRAKKILTNNKFKKWVNDLSESEKLNLTEQIRNESLNFN